MGWYPTATTKQLRGGKPEQRHEVPTASVPLIDELSPTREGQNHQSNPESFPSQREDRDPGFGDKNAPTLS
ncbi:hypothetical protein RSSM_00459 [Rhodopirellula sallentina SM41]|uniref:Uncharacterized protein n=1 Tax=Rhodopirellula sallentina SM41 TaxID=1263870 RepID=M5U9V3_9BACT|nr:hypothetical protein RSSM_00459 [Rhodopirellula sallentina SM41]